MIQMQMAQQNVGRAGKIHRSVQKSASGIEKHGLFSRLDHVAGSIAAEELLIFPGDCHGSPCPQHFEAQAALFCKHFRFFSFNSTCITPENLLHL